MPPRSWSALLIFTAGWPAWAAAQPVGDEFRVNSHTPGPQYRASAAADPSGNFVVLWMSYNQDGSSFGVFGQRFDREGTARGAEFQVNSHTTSFQRFPRVAADGDGDFVVVWESNDQDGSGVGVFGRRFDAAGVPQGSEFLVNALTAGDQTFPVVASDPDGNFVVVWGSSTGDGNSFAVRGRRFDAAGVAQGMEFVVNAYTTGIQRHPSVAMDAAGNFVVAWESVGQDGDSAGVFGQRFDAAGVKQGAEFRANTYTTSFQRFPAVASDPGGKFLVTWWSIQDGSSYGIYAQRYDDAGAVQGGEFRVNAFTTNRQDSVSLAADAQGNFLVTWSSDGQDGDSWGIYGQRYDTAGVPQAAEFRVNAYTMYAQQLPAVAPQGHGGFVVVWSSSNPTDVFGRRLDDLIFEDGFQS